MATKCVACGEEHGDEAYGFCLGVTGEIDRLRRQLAQSQAENAKLTAKLTLLDNNYLVCQAQWATAQVIADMVLHFGQVELAMDKCPTHEVADEIGVVDAHVDAYNAIKVAGRALAIAAAEQAAKEPK